MDVLVVTTGSSCQLADRQRTCTFQVFQHCPSCRGQVAQQQWQTLETEPYFRTAGLAPACQFPGSLEPVERVPRTTNADLNLPLCHVCLHIFSRRIRNPCAAWQPKQTCRVLPVPLCDGGHLCRSRYRSGPDISRLVRVTSSEIHGFWHYWQTQRILPRMRGPRGEPP